MTQAPHLKNGIHYISGLDRRTRPDRDAAPQKLLTKLEAENVDLRNRAVELALQIQSLREDEMPLATRQLETSAGARRSGDAPNR